MLVLLLLLLLMIQQIKQSTVKCLHVTDGGDKKNIKGKKCKVQSVQSY